MSDSLEKEADELLRKDAEAQGFIKKDGTYGFGAYAKKYGILTKHDIATIRIYERPDFGNRIGNGVGDIGNSPEEEQ